jgi:hypothetical protein
LVFCVSFLFGGGWGSLLVGICYFCALATAKSADLGRFYVGAGAPERGVARVFSFYHAVNRVLVTS